MFPIISPRLREDIHRVVRQAKEASGSVNISVLAERVRRRHIAENVALEDIAEAMIHAAQAIGAPCVFDGECAFSHAIEIISPESEWATQVQPEQAIQ